MNKTNAFDIPTESIFSKEFGKLRMQQGSVRAGQIRREQIAKTEVFGVHIYQSKRNKDAQTKK